MSTKSDASLPPGVAAPHTDDELKRLRLFDGLDDEAVTDRKVAEMCGLDSLGRAVMLPELDYVRLRRAATRANRPPDEEHGRPSEWERVVRELGDLKEAILAATGYRDPSVGRMLTTDQIVERVTRASRERAAALPPTDTDVNVPAVRAAAQAGTPTDAVKKFTYLLNAMEAAAQAVTPAACGYGAKRQAVFDFVAALAVGAPADDKMRAALLQVQAEVTHKNGGVEAPAGVGLTFIKRVVDEALGAPASASGRPSHESLARLSEYWKDRAQSVERILAAVGAPAAPAPTNVTCECQRGPREIVEHTDDAGTSWWTLANLCTTCLTEGAPDAR